MNGIGGSESYACIEKLTGSGNFYGEAIEEHLLYQHQETEIETLFQTCLKICVENANRISDIGDIPYELVRPILQRMGPAQLREIERQSPQLVPSTGEIWDAHIKHTFTKEEIEWAEKRANSDRVRRKLAGRNLENKYFLLVEARKKREMQTSAAVKAQYEEIEREKAKHRIVALDVLVDPEARRRGGGGRLINYGEKSTKKMSLLKRTQYETLSNRLFGGSGEVGENSVTIVSAEEGERRRRERMEKRMEERRQLIEGKEERSRLKEIVESHKSDSITRIIQKQEAERKIRKRARR
ncbi:RNA polymerase II transcription factor SIII subunit A-domain-containing protein [Lipomyces oligophaga]|uniref:RNA polymerase II transcription factor SIII subunit A-domain-containing protein n=1 Tax=Lipomyces oligophaga TaxID=45792 RepID=UPI0034CD3E84